MLNVYDILPFDNSDGGASGWSLEYNPKRIQREPKLEVIVVPHSHDDPGWLRTFEEYFADSVVKILDGMVASLTSNARMKFIYAEMSFFELWWAQRGEQVRNQVRR